jgi:hypothetical protein
MVFYHKSLQEVKNYFPMCDNRLPTPATPQRSLGTLSEGASHQTGHLAPWLDGLLLLLTHVKSELLCRSGVDTIQVDLCHLSPYEDRLPHIAAVDEVRERWSNS